MMVVYQLFGLVFKIFFVLSVNFIGIALEQRGRQLFYDARDFVLGSLEAAEALVEVVDNELIVDLRHLVQLLLHRGVPMVLNRVVGAAF